MSEILAIDGGTPVRSKPMPAWPEFGAEEITAVSDVLKSGKVNYWTGPRGKEFEEKWAQECDAAFGVAVANGTMALEVALRALQIGPGDDVLVPAKSFIATASCVVMVGARPVVVDIDPYTNNLTAETCEASMTPQTKAIIAVHLGGWPVEMDALMDFARKNGLLVIEDCAQAHGARHKGRPVGGIGDAGCFSFCQDKIVPMGEGGLVVFNEYEPYRRAWEFKDHGKSLERCMTDDPLAREGSYRFLVDSFGTNMRLGEMESALGVVGLERLGRYHRKRTENAQQIVTGLAGVAGIGFSVPLEDVEHAYYRLYGRIDVSRLNDGWTRDRVLAAITAEGTPVQYGSCSELYREKAFIDAGFVPATPLPGALRSHEESICFFVHPTLNKDDIEDTVAAVKKVLATAISQ